jgi:methylmalonyl-CoA carboxyltransferase large subunit
MNFTSLLIVALAVVIGCVLTYVGSQRAFRRRSAEMQRANERRLQSLSKTILDLEARVTEMRKAPVVTLPAAAPAAPETSQKKEEVSQEVLLVLAAAVTAFLGKKVKIRSAKMLQSPYEIVNPWSQQGRVIVQASHNLRSGG